MNATEERAQEAHLLDSLAPFETFAATILGTAPRKFYAFNTLQFKDYSQYESSIFSEADKKRITRNTLPRNCNRPMNWAGNW